MISLMSKDTLELVDACHGIDPRNNLSNLDHFGIEDVKDQSFETFSSRIQMSGDTYQN